MTRDEIMVEICNILWYYQTIEHRIEIQTSCVMRHLGRIHFSPAIKCRLISVNVIDDFLVIASSKRIASIWVYRNLMLQNIGGWYMRLWIQASHMTLVILFEFVFVSHEPQSHHPCHRHIKAIISHHHKCFPCFGDLSFLYWRMLRIFRRKNYNLFDVGTSYVYITGSVSHFYFYLLVLCSYTYFGFAVLKDDTTF